MLACTVCCASNSSCTTQLHRSPHWLPIDARITFKIIVLTHRVQQQHQPTYLSTMIADYIPTQPLSLAGTELLVILRWKTVTASRAFRVAASKISNSLHLMIRSSDSPVSGVMASTQVSLVRCCEQLIVAWLPSAPSSKDWIAVVGQRH